MIRSEPVGHFVRMKPKIKYRMVPDNRINKNGEAEVVWFYEFWIFKKHKPVIRWFLKPRWIISIVINNKNFGYNYSLIKIKEG